MNGVDLYNGRKIRRGILGIGVNVQEDSIVSPSSKNNIVGIKPTIGLVSRTKGEFSKRQFYEATC